MIWCAPAAGRVGTCLDTEIGDKRGVDAALLNSRSGEDGSGGSADNGGDGGELHDDKDGVLERKGS